MKRVKLLAYGVGLTLFGNVAFSEDIETIDLGRSVKTATGYEQDIKEAPASISIIPQEELLSRPVRDLSDALQEVPGISSDVSKTGASTISIRGLSSAYTLILIDGKKQNTNGAFGGQGFDPNSGFMPPASMIDRIEIIRGPASVIYGSSAMGGVINIITKKMPSKPTGSLMLETRLQENRYNWGDMYGMNGFVAAPLIKNTLGINLRGKYNASGANRFYKKDVPGFTDTTSIQKNPYISHSPTEYRTASLGGRMDYVIDKQNSLYLDHEFNYQMLGTLNTNAAQFTAVRDYRKYNSVLNHDGKYSWGDLNTYIQYANTQQIPHKTPQNHGDTTTPLNYAARQVNQDVIFNSVWKDLYAFDDYGSLLVQAGLNYEYESFDKAITDAQREPTGQWYRNHYNQAAIFGEAEYLPLDLVGLTAGLRVNYNDFTNFSAHPRFYLNINPTSYFTIKAGVSSGMKIPNLDMLFEGLTITNGSNNNTTHTYGNKNLKPESTWNYELSMIFDIKPVYITLTGYWTDFRDAVKSQSYTQNASMPNGISCGANECIMYENVDKAMSAGAEVGFNMKRFYGVGFDANYAFNYTKQLSGVNKGLALSSAPQHTASAKLSYKYADFDTYLRYIGKFRATTKLAHSANSGIGDWYKDVHLLDLGASYRIKDTYTLSFAINNLLNTNFAKFVAYQRNGNQSITNLYQRMIPSRNYWVSLKADF